VSPGAVGKVEVGVKTGATGQGVQVREQSLRRLAYDSLRADILMGDLASGTPISESERAESLGISRTPVREAMQQLAREGLIEIFPKRGTFVVRLSARDVRESFELREAIETFAARLAAERRTDDDLERMRAALADPPAASGAIRYARAADFHRVIVQAARNRYLLQSFEGSTDRIDLASRLAASIPAAPRPESSHQAIFDAIEQADELAAEDAMRRHLRQHAMALLEHLR
jgi:DNA-binding GntR family transcriptional regulator